MSAQLPTALSLIYRDRVRSCPAAKVPRGRPDEGVAPGNWWSVFAPTESIGPIVLWLLFIESLRSTVQARPCSDATVATAVAANLAAHIAATVPEGMGGMSEERERRDVGRRQFQRRCVAFSPATSVGLTALQHHPAPASALHHKHHAAYQEVNLSNWRLRLDSGY